MPVFLLALIAIFQSSAPPAGDALIHVDIDGLRSEKGKVLCAIFASADGFPKDASKAPGVARSSISGSHAACEFSGLRPGKYAVSMFHDENSNGKLDTNFIGIPREGVGASNNPKARLGPPKFQDASFAFPGGKMDLKVTIQY